MRAARSRSTGEADGERQHDRESVAGIRSEEEAGGGVGPTSGPSRQTRARARAGLVVAQRRRGKAGLRAGPRTRT